MGAGYICEDAMIKDDKELNDVVCAAYKMGCDQTREVYQKRIEQLQAALLDLSEGWECCPVSQAIRRVARKALEGKDD